MVKSEIIVKRLSKLDEYVRLLEHLREHSKDAIVNDPYVYGNVERYLQLAIQTVIDIGNHLLAEKKAREVNEYRDVLEKLGAEGIIPSQLAAKIAPMAGLRNILVHDYLDIDREKLYDLLRTHLDDFKEFGRHIAKLL